MSEKKQSPKRDGRGLRLSAIIPTLFSTGAFALQLIAILSGTSPGQLQDFGLITLNTTNLGQKLIIFTPNSTKTKEITAVSTEPFSDLKVFSDINLDPFSIFPTFPNILPTIPARSAASQSSAVVTSGLKSSSTLAPETTGSTSLSTSNMLASSSSVSSTRVSSTSTKASLSIPTTSLGSIPSSLLSITPTSIATVLPTTIPTPANGTTSATFAEDLLNGILSAVGKVLISAIAGNVDLNSVVAQMAAALKESIGIEDYYSFHLRAVCRGKISTESGADKYRNINCTTYSKLGDSLATKSHNFTSSYQVLTENVTIPILGKAGDYVDDLRSIVRGVSTTNDVLHFTTLVGSALTALLSFIAIFKPRSTRIVGVAGLAALFGAFFQAVSAVFMTILIYVIVPQINKFGNILGIFASHGSSFLIIAWISFGLAQFAGLYWDLAWFAGTRRGSFKRRMRTSAQRKAGREWNVKAVWKEVRNDLRNPNGDPGDGMEEGLVQRRVTVKRERVGNEEEGTYVYRVTANNDVNSIRGVEL